MLSRVWVLCIVGMHMHVLYAYMGDTVLYRVCACKQYVNAVYIPLCVWMRMCYTMLLWPHVYMEDVRKVVLHCLIRLNLHRPDKGVNCPD